MKDNKAFKDKVEKIASINDVGKLKLEICSILTAMILSKDFFKYTRDINPFLQNLDVDFRDYVFKNRMLLLGKLLKLIMEQDQEERIYFYRKTICDLIIAYYNQTNEIAISIARENNEKKKEPDNNKGNYMMELLKKYSRNKNYNEK